MNDVKDLITIRPGGTTTATTMPGTAEQTDLTS
jgi:hypothetical protein